MRELSIFKIVYALTYKHRDMVTLLKIISQSTENLMKFISFKIYVCFKLIEHQCYSRIIGVHIETSAQHLVFVSRQAI
jgi:hypothetical protein